MDTAGNQLLDVPNNDPFYLAADSQGSVYVTHLFSHDVQVFNSSGTLVRTITTGFLVSAIDVTIGPDFTIYVLGSSSVSTDLHVEKFTRFGVPIGQFSVPPGVGAPGIAIDALQRLYVSDTSGTISVYTKTGGFLGDFGSFGSGPLQFKDPAVAAPDALGILYVVDRNNDRVQKLTETSSLIITVSDDVPPTPYTFTVTNGPTSVPSFQLDDDPASPLPGQRNITALVPGVYRVTIAGGPNTPKTITCSNGQQVTDYASSHIDVTVLAGQTVSCNFYVEWIG
jgi:hypothetical protein